MSKYTLSPSQTDFRVCIAYVDRKTEEELNKNREKNTDIYKDKTGLYRFFTSIMETIIRRYNSQQNYVHCEVVFPVDNSPGECIAFAVFSDLGLVRQQRTFANPSYNYIWLSVSKEDYWNSYQFCMDEVEKKIKFDYSGVKRMPVWPRNPPITRSLWCASFTVCFLHKIGILKYYRINTLDVDDIIEILNQSNRKILGFTPLQMNTIKSNEYSNSIFYGNNMV
jgi:hypothetical protein